MKSFGLSRSRISTDIRHIFSQAIVAASFALCNILEGQQGVTATFRCADGRVLHVRKATRAEPALRRIYDALGIDPRPGGTRKTTIQRRQSGAS